MGLEATCAATLDGERARGKALLETTEVVFRGAARCVVTLDAARASARVSGGWLKLGALELELGPVQAARWLQRIKNPKSVLEKLGVKAGQVATVLGDDAFARELEGRGLTLSDHGADVVFLFVHSAADLKRITALRKRLRNDASLWLIRPKGQHAGVTEMQTMTAGRAAGLVDVKVVSFSDALSALKYVVPVAKRK